MGSIARTIGRGELADNREHCKARPFCGTLRSKRASASLVLTVITRADLGIGVAARAMNTVIIEERSARLMSCRANLTSLLVSIGSTNQSAPCARRRLDKYRMHDPGPARSLGGCPRIRRH